MPIANRCNLCTSRPHEREAWQRYRGEITTAGAMSTMEAHSHEAAVEAAHRAFHRGYEAAGEGVHLGTLLVYATRYAFGRMTVAVHEVCTMLRTLGPRMSKADRETVIRDIQNAIDHAHAEGKTLGMRSDESLWADTNRFLQTCR